MKYFKLKTGETIPESFILKKSYWELKNGDHVVIYPDTKGIFTVKYINGLLCKNYLSFSFDYLDADNNVIECSLDKFNKIKAFL